MFFNYVVDFILLMLPSILQFKERFLRLASESTLQPVRKKKVPRHRAMMALLDDDSESESPAAVSHSASPSPAPTQESATPWLQEFNKYLDTEEELPPDVTAVTWWGVCD